MKLYIKQLCHQQDPPGFPVGIPGFPDVDIPVFIRDNAPPLTAASLVMIAEMVVPQFLSSSTSIPNFAGPQPGTLGGGISLLYGIFVLRTTFREPSSLRSSNSAHEKVRTRKNRSTK